MTGPVLVTGAAGFVGRHLLVALRRRGHTVAAWRRPSGQARSDSLSPEAPAARATSQPRSASERGSGPASAEKMMGETLRVRGSGPVDLGAPGAEVRWQEIDALDREAVRRALEALQPVAAYHLAGAANVHTSWTQTLSTLQTNVMGTLNLLEAIRGLGRPVRILIPGSALIYKPSAAAIGEDGAIGPVSPYGLSKLAQEMLAVRFAQESGADVLIARAFTHVGPGQNPSFSASSFAQQIARIEAGQSEPRLTVGNLTARRDITDVRDTVEAYRLLVERGIPARPYNVCTGVAHEIGDILKGLLAHARVKVTVEVDSSRLRPNDNPLLLGDPSRIRDEVGWRPSIPLSDTLRDLLDYWRAVVQASASQAAKY